MQEKFRAKGKKLYFGFVDLEKAFNRVPRELIRLTMGVVDDLVVTPETEDDQIKRVNEWKDNTENRGMRVSMNKTKVMVNEERQKVMQKAVRRPRGVCSRGIGNNSTECTSCQKLVHRKCCDINGSKYKVMKTFVCIDCMNPVTSTQCTASMSMLIWS